MSIRFECQHCQKKMGVDDKFAGKKILCPKCRQPIAVPTVSILDLGTPKPVPTSDATPPKPLMKAEIQVPPAAPVAVAEVPTSDPGMVWKTRAEVRNPNPATSLVGKEHESSTEVIHVSRTRLVNSAEYMIEGSVSLELGLEGVQEFLEALKKAPPVIKLDPRTLRRVLRLILAISESFVADANPERDHRLLLKARVSAEGVTFTAGLLGEGDAYSMQRVSNLARQYQELYRAEVSQDDTQRSLTMGIGFRHLIENMDDSVELNLPLLQREEDPTTGRTRFFMDVSSKRLWPQLGRLREESSEAFSSLGVDDLASMQVQLAMDEMITNSLVHGNCDVASSKDGSHKRDPNFTKNIQHALDTTPSGKKRVHMLLEYDWTGISVLISDEGKGFDVRKIVERYNANPHAQHGRGIPLVRKIADRYRYTKGGRCVWFHVPSIRKAKDAPLADVEVED